MHGESERRLQHLLLLETHPEAQHDARNEARELTGQLDASPLHEEIDDRPVELLPARRRQGLRPGPADVHAAALSLQQAGDGATAANVAIHQQNSHERSIGQPHIAGCQSNPRTTPARAFSCS